MGAAQRVLVHEHGSSLMMRTMHHLMQQQTSSKVSSTHPIKADISPGRRYPLTSFSRAIFFFLSLRLVMV